MFRTVFPAIIAATFFAGSALAESYKCQIENYGRPVNFAGGFQAQKELLKSWMPYEVFYVVTDGDRATLYHSGDLEIESRSSNVEENTLAFTFRDYPYADGGSSRFRDTRFTLSLDSMDFSIRLKMNPGPRYRKSGGSAFGSCQRE